MNMGSSDCGCVTVCKQVKCMQQCLSEYAPSWDTWDVWVFHVGELPEPHYIPTVCFVQCRYIIQHKSALDIYKLNVYKSDQEEDQNTFSTFNYKFSSSGIIRFLFWNREKVWGKRKRVGQSVIRGNAQMGASCHGFRVATASGADGRLAAGCLTAADGAT